MCIYEVPLNQRFRLSTPPPQKKNTTWNNSVTENNLLKNSGYLPRRSWFKKFYKGDILPIWYSGFHEAASPPTGWKSLVAPPTLDAVMGPTEERMVVAADAEMGCVTAGVVLVAVSWVGFDMAMVWTMGPTAEPTAAAALDKDCVAIVANKARSTVQRNTHFDWSVMQKGEYQLIIQFALCHILKPTLSMISTCSYRLNTVWLFCWYHYSKSIAWLIQYRRIVLDV